MVLYFLSSESITHVPKKGAGITKRGNPHIFSILEYFFILFSVHFFLGVTCGLLTFSRYIVNIYWPWKLYHKQLNNITV